MLNTLLNRIWILKPKMILKEVWEDKRMRRKLVVVLFCVALVLSLPMYASAATKKAEETKPFYGVHTSYGSSYWGVKFKIELDYTNDSSTYVAKELSTIATMYPAHTYGVGYVILAGIEEQVDYGTKVNRSIRPTTSSFWTYQPVIVNTGTKVYYSYKGTMDKDFRYVLDEVGTFTFSVPDTYMPNPNFTLTLSVQGRN